MTRRARSVVPGRGNHGLEQRVIGFFRDLRSSLPSGPLVVGFSGGPDSLALLLVLRQVRAVLDRDLLALHVDHRLRPESEADALSAQLLAAQIGVPLHLERLAAGLSGRHHGVGREEAARRERYAAACRFCAAVDGAFVTGHHADDQAETVLLHLLRGSGMVGAGGMRPLTRLSVPWWQTVIPVRPTTLPVVRPFLSTRRQEIDRYLAERAGDLSPVLDPSNLDPAFRRNAVRHDLIPVLEQAVPGAVTALNRFARIAAEENELLDVMAASALITATDGQRRLIRSALSAQPVAIARRVIRAWLLAALPTEEMTLERVEAVRERAASADGRWSIEVAGGLSVICESGLLTIQRSGPVLAGSTSR